MEQSATIRVTIPGSLRRKLKVLGSLTGKEMGPGTPHFREILLEALEHYLTILEAEFLAQARESFDPTDSFECSVAELVAILES